MFSVFWDYGIAVIAVAKNSVVGAPMKKQNGEANTMDQNSGCDCFVLKLKLKTEIWGMVKHLLST